LITFPEQTHFYDQELAAVHYGVKGGEPSARRIAALRELPRHRERFLEDEISDTQGRTVHSARTSPAVSIGGLRIPTGWFEHWKLPIPVDSASLPFDVTVTGYLPYINSLEPMARGGGGKENPAINYTLSFGGKQLRATLFADIPAASLSDRVNIEFRWLRDEAELAAILREPVGRNELEIEVVDPPARKVVAIESGQVIAVEGTPYELKVGELLPAWPLMSPGFENARSPVARIDVKRGDVTYNRTVVQRFPDFSQDIDSAGTRHRDGPYDRNLKLRYRTATEDGWMTVVAGPKVKPRLVHFQPSGKLTTAEISPQKPLPIAVQGGTLHVTIDAIIPDATIAMMPLVEPLEFRRPRDRDVSAIRLTFTGRGPLAGWSDSRWTPYRMYPDLGDMDALSVTPPGDHGTYEFVYSRYPRPLPAALTGRRLDVEYFPGRQTVSAWQSDFLAHEAGAAPRPLMVKTNAIATVGPWTLFQSGAAQDNWSYTILGVGNRNGILAMLLGCVLITVGCLYAFYVKPVLVRRRQARALAEASIRDRKVADEPLRRPAPQDEPLVEVRS
jgi:hypothetical protein